MDKDQVITIEGNESQWYKQAVFVIKEEVAQSYVHKDLKEEAEWIIGKHLKKNGFSPLKPARATSAKTDQALNIVLWASACILMICLALL